MRSIRKLSVGCRSGRNRRSARVAAARDALSRRLGRGDARDADPPRRAARVANAPLRGTSEQLQQFSTPIALGFVAAEAAALTPADLVLEPSAGTEPLAIFAELAKVRPALNEIADTRAALLSRLFREVAVTLHNAEQIHDRLDPTIRPSVVLMNPPFSTSPHVEGRFAEAAIWHIGSARRGSPRADGSSRSPARSSAPDQPESRESFIRLQEKAASSSPRRSRARFMSATVRAWKRG